MDNCFDFSSIGKRMPYTVPDDFFDKMEENVCASLKGKRKVMIKRLFLAAAAAIALFFVLKATLFKSESIATDDFASVELAFNNLSTDDQDYLIAVYEEDEFINELELN